MIVPWRIHVLDKDKENFINSLMRVWDGSLDILWSPLPSRHLLICYADNDEKSILHLKFDLIEDSKVLVSDEKC